LPLVTVAGESASTWQEVIDLLAQQQATLTALAGPATQPVLPVSASKPATPSPASLDTAAAPTPAAPAIEVAEGSAITVLFNAQRCIHSRHCVLDAPSVFKANTPGTWIYPDTVHVETVVGVAHACPSGAIRYQRSDGGPEEAPPAVNQLRIRENGPYAVHAPLTIAGQDDGLRATLCRCGQSRNKPWCDGSHVAAGFTASGEPASASVEALPQRDGPLTITSLRNGPLHVAGPLEICAGTGRTVHRCTEVKLCRCGQSRNKPFCDLSHVAAGFEAGGA
jgi:CDGSH-type Zn-finger protein/uncharacterized Fe-S cluster protein YjdI